MCLFYNASLKLNYRSGERRFHPFAKFVPYRKSCTRTHSRQIPTASDARPLTPPAVSSLGGLRTPAPGVRRATVMGPASANFHNSGRSREFRFRPTADSRRLKCRFISDRRACWSLCKRQQNGGQCRGGLVGPRLLVDRELKVRKPRQSVLNTENAQARDQRAGRKRGDGEARERCRTHASQTGASVGDLPGQFVVVERGECSLAGDGSLAVQGQRQRRTWNKVERVCRGPD